MVDNQHKKISGYRDLSDETIVKINFIKKLGLDLQEFIHNEESILKDTANTETADPRWLAIAKTDLQKGIMFLVRSIAKPEGF